MNHFQAIVAQLEADWPDWQVWYVPRAVGGMIWCGRRWDETGETLNADDPEELAKYLADEAGARRAVSATPAAELARLKVTSPGWRFARTTDGFIAVERSTGRRISAATVTELETALAQS